jgi:hypothetical protein
LPQVQINIKSESYNMATKSKTTATAPATPAGVARTQANRKRRLTQLLKQQPNNKQIQNALLEVGALRKKPTNPQWSHSNIRLAKLFKEFTGRAHKDLFSSNPKVQQAALQVPGTKVFHNLPQGKVDFSIGARAFMRTGGTWN